jgi:hypothetical protein
MMRVRRWVAVPAMASALLACSLLKKSGAGDGGIDGAAEGAASASASVADAGPAEAANAAEVTRYPDEKPFDHATLTAESGGNMRTQAGAAGDLIIILKRATEVEKIAERGGYYLVIADDPKETTRKIMGWVAESAFGAGGEPAHKREGDNPNPAPGKLVDAGGSKPPAPSKRLDVKKSANGSCPSGYAPCSAICRATCKAAVDCGDPAAKCTGGFCLGPGAAACK